MAGGREAIMALERTLANQLRGLGEEPDLYGPKRSSGESGQQNLHVDAASPTPVPPPVPEAVVDMTGAVDLAMVGVEPLPFVASREPPKFPPSDVRPRDPNGETGVVDLAAVMKVATPFEVPPAPPQPPPIETPPPVPASSRAAEEGHGATGNVPVSPSDHGVDETGVLDPAVLASLGPALPFVTPAEAMPSPVEPRAVAPEGRRVDLAQVDTGTAIVPGVEALMRGPATPFERVGARPPDTCGALASEAAPMGASAAPASTPGDRPYEEQNSHPSTHRDERPSTVWNDVRRYASFRVDVRRAPEQEAELRRRYGIGDEAEQATLVGEYNRRFGADDRLVAAYQESVKTYMAWLDQHAGTAADREE
ncbi:MAG: hypothetical protein AAF928_17885 [Myxococcota bacterium]